MLGRKVIYVRCIKCSYKNATKGIRLLDSKAFFVHTGKKVMQVRAFERYISLMTPGLWIIRTTWTREVLHTEYEAVGHTVLEKIV